MGTLLHHFKETGLLTGCFPYPPTTEQLKIIATAERKVFMSGIDREKWWPAGTGNHEVTFAFHAFTLELRQYEGPRGAADEWKKQFDPLKWVTGSFDWLGRRFDRWHVDDLKTGAWPVDVETSKQLRTYAIVAWLLDGQQIDWECDVSITSWPKYPLAGEPVRTWHVLTGFDLAEHLADIRWALSNTQYVNPSPYDDPQSDKLPNCAGCECREPVPTSGWITNFWFRTLPHCVPGMLVMLKRKNGI